MAADSNPTMAAESNRSMDPKSPPKALRSHRQLSQRAMQHSHREPEHEAFGLEPPPTRTEIGRMMCSTAIRILKEHMSQPEAVVNVCDRLGYTQNQEGRQEAAEAGAIPALISAMQTHPNEAIIIEKATGALGNLCCGTDELGLQRKQLAADAGALSAIVVGMKLHEGVVAVQENAAATIGNIASNVDDAGLARKQIAADAGAIEAIVASLNAHAKVASACNFGCFAIGNIVRGRGDKERDDAGAARKQRAVEAGALPAVVACLEEHPMEPHVQEHGSRAIANITFRNDELKQKAIDAGATSETLDGAVTVRVFVPEKEVENGKAEDGVDLSEFTTLTSREWTELGKPAEP